jgi:hypothetical protein
MYGNVTMKPPVQLLYANKNGLKCGEKKFLGIIYDSNNFQRSSLKSSIRT